MSYCFNQDERVPDALKLFVASLQAQISNEELKIAVKDFLDGGESVSWSMFESSPPSDIEKARQITLVVEYCWDSQENANYVRTYR